MTLYSKWFNTHSEYEAYKNGLNYILPNVSICYNDLDVHYEKYVRDYSKEYLTFEALEDTEFSIVYEGIKGEYVTQAMRESFSYSIDNGETWVTFTTPNDEYSGTALTTPTIRSGEKVLWKGVGNCNGIGDAYCHITATGEFNVSGNIMSLLYDDDFIGETDLSNMTNPFSFLFMDNAELVSAENMILPAETLCDYCYWAMFSGCTSLTTAPLELPATTLAQICYQSMFSGCTSLTTAPELPATTLTYACYEYMFYGCTSLTTAPELPASTLAEICYSNMFGGCSNLNYIKAMFTTTPSNLYTNGWVNGVAAIGTFVKNSAATWNVTGTEGIPSGWDVQTASA